MIRISHAPFPAGRGKMWLYLMNCRFHSACLLLTAGALLLAGCRTLPRHETASNEPLSTNGVEAVKSQLARISSSERETLAHAHYATAVVLALNDEPARALEEYFKAAIYDSREDSLVLETSRRLLQARQPGKALELLQVATSNPHPSGAILARLGLVYSQLGETNQAIAANRAAVKKAPDSLAGYQNLFVNYLQTKQPKDALKVLDDAADQKGTDTGFLLGLAELYVNYTLQFPTQREAVQKRALAVLDRVAALKPVTTRDRLKLADDYSFFGSSEKAAPLYSELAGEYQDLPVVRDAIRSKLADIYLRDNDRNKAAEQLKAILADDPSNAQAYYFLGVLASEQQQWTNAVDNLQKTVLFSPEFEQAYYDLARAQIATDRPEDALLTLDQAKQKFRDRFIGEYLRGVAHLDRKLYPQAITNFTTAEVIAGAEDTNRLTDGFYFQFGAAFERNGDYGQAEKYFRKCLALSPDFSDALNYLGYMWAEHDTNLVEARSLIERALKLEPDNAAFLDSMGWVLFKLNQPQQALGYVLKAVAGTREADETLYDHLGDIYAELKEMDKARDAWRKSLAVQSNDKVRQKLEAAQPR